HAHPARHRVRLPRVRRGAGELALLSVSRCIESAGEVRCALVRGYDHRTTACPGGLARSAAGRPTDPCAPHVQGHHDLVAIRRFGVSPRNESRAGLHRARGKVVLSVRAPASKVLSLGGAMRWRADAGRVAFTNGVFDLLHPGHVDLLLTARNTADALIVGINSDDSVRRLKGAGRPVRSAADRAYVLAALECVDAVVVFP